MPKDPSELIVGANGAVRVAPVGTDFPLTPTAAATGFYDLGYISEDGVKPVIGKTVQNIRGWQSFHALRRIVTEQDFSVAFTMLQWNAESFSLAFGGGEVIEVDDYEGVYRYDPPPPEEIDERAMIVDWLDGEYAFRLCLPRGSVSDNVETNIMRTDAAKLPITFGILGEEGVNPWWLITNHPAFQPAA